MDRWVSLLSHSDRFEAERISVTAVPAVTNSHPNRVDHVVGGNTSGRIQLWTSAEST